MATVLLVPSKPNSSPVFGFALAGNAVDVPGFTVSGDRLPPDLFFFERKLKLQACRAGQVMKLLGATDSPASSTGSSLSAGSACRFALTGNGQMLRIFTIRLAGLSACGS